MSDGVENPLLDHDVDGIREYDNPLPGWWVALFWVTTVFAFPYYLFFHATPGRTIHDEYDAEVAAKAARLIATYGNLANEEPTIQKYMHDPIAMSGMNSVFKAKRAQCHAADGGGGVGPNLTDDFYINVKTMTDIANVIRVGVPLKGMPTWGGQLSETEIVLMSSYIAQLRGKPITGKAPQGEKIAPWPQAADPAPSKGSGAN